MKKIITLAALLATAHIYCQDIEPSQHQAMKKIDITFKTEYPDGQISEASETIIALAIELDEADELKANHEHSTIESLKGSRIYNRTFMIGDQAYIIINKNNNGQKRWINVSVDDYTPEAIA